MQANQIMRTTITLEDDAYATAQAYAKAHAIKLGQAISELIQRSSSGKVPIKQTNGVWMFDLPPDTPILAARHVKRLLGKSP